MLKRIEKYAVGRAVTRRQFLAITLSTGRHKYLLNIKPREQVPQP